MNESPLPHKGLMIEAEAATRRGYSHANNEDSYLVSFQSQVFVVADGMGGHRDGHVASQTTVAAIKDHVSPGAPFEQRVEQTMQAVTAANAHLFAAADRDISGSTLVALVMGETYACGLWVGDSRLYLLRDSHLYPISEDHASPSGALTRAVGSSRTIDIERRVFEIRDGDIFVLCSDGLLKGMPESDLVAMLSGDSQHVADRLLAKSIAGGSTDDVTLILVWVSRDGAG